MPGEKLPPLETEVQIDFGRLDGDLKQLQTLLKKLDPAMAGTEQSFRKVEQGARGASGAFGGLFKQLTAANIAAQAINRSFYEMQRLSKLAFTEPIRQAANFETILAKISTVLESSTTEQIKALGDEILEMSRKFPKSADELGVGLYNILQKGVEDSADAMLLLEASAKAAVAGTTEVGTASSLLTTIMNAYNISAEETVALLDSIFVGAQMGSAEFEDLATSMGDSLNSAALLGVELPEVVAAIETMVNAGISSDEASTALNRLFQSVIQASKGTGEAAEVAKKLGLEFNSTALRTDGLQKFMEKLAKAVGNDEVAMQILTQDVRAFKAAASIAGIGAEDFTEMLHQMEVQVGATEKAYAKNMDTVQNFAQLAKNELNAILIEIGQDSLPMLKEALEDIKGVLGENREEIIAAGQALSQSLVKGIQTVIENAPDIIKALEGIAKAAGLVVGAITKVMEFYNWATESNLGRGIILGQLGVAQSLPTPEVQPDLFTPANLGYTPAYAGAKSTPPPSRAQSLMGAGGARPDLTGGGGDDKAAKEEKKRLEDIYKATLEFERDKLELRKQELEVLKDTVGLTKLQERALKNVEAALDGAFDVENARDFPELMTALGKQTDNLVKKYDKVRDSIAKAKDELKEMYEESKKREEDLGVELADLMGAQSEERAKERAENIADVIIEAEKRMAELEALPIKTLEELKEIDALRKTLDTRDKLTAGAANAPDSVELARLEKERHLLEAQRRGEQLRADANEVGAKEKVLELTKEIEAVEKKIADMRKVSADDESTMLARTLEERRKGDEQSALEKQIAIEDELDAKLEAEKERVQENIDLEKAFQEGKLQEYLDAKGDELDAEQQLHAQRLMHKEAEIKSELTQQETFQKDLTTILTLQITVRDEAQEAYTKNEESRLGRIKQAAIDAANAIASARAAAEGVGSGGVGAATGGYIRGPGSETSDSIPAWLSDGEYVVKAAAVRKYGVDFLHRVNSMSMDGMRFSRGGPVDQSTHTSKSTTASFHFHGEAARVAANPAMLRWHLRKAA